MTGWRREEQLEGMFLLPIADSSMVKGLADFVRALQHENHICDDNASDHDDELDFVDVMVAGITVMTQLPVVPPSLPTRPISVIAEFPSVPMKKKRKYKSGSQLWTNPITGISSRLSPFMSQWYIFYIQNAPSQDPRFLCKFRRRFRVPYGYFQELSAELKEREQFRPWWTGATDSLGKPSMSITLFVLTALCYIGRAWTLDDLSENACIGEEVVRRFLHKFLRYASTKMVIRVFANFMKTHVVVDAADGRPQFW
jgi:hypothetical protein